MFEDKFRYLFMVNHLYKNCLEDCSEWGENFIRSIKIQLESHPDFENLTEDEAREFLTHKQKAAIISIWEEQGL